MAWKRSFKIQVDIFYLALPFAFIECLDGLLNKHRPDFMPERVLDPFSDLIYKLTFFLSAPVFQLVNVRQKFFPSH